MMSELTVRMRRIGEGESWAPPGDMQVLLRDAAAIIDNLEEVADSSRMLTRKLDTLLNGVGAAAHPSLADLVSQVQARILGSRREDGRANVTLRVDGREYPLVPDTTREPGGGYRVVFDRSNAPYVQARLDVVHASGCGIGRSRSKYRCTCGGLELFRAFLEGRGVR